MQYIVIAVAAFLIWKNWDKIKGLISPNITPVPPQPQTRPIPPQEPQPGPNPDEVNAFYREAGRVAMNNLRDHHQDEYERYVQEWIDANWVRS